MYIGLWACTSDCERVHRTVGVYIGLWACTSDCERVHRTVGVYIGLYSGIAYDVCALTGSKHSILHYSGV